jgi:hypothetical protein
VLSLLLSLGDNNQPGGDVAQAQLLAAQVQRHGERVVVGDAGAADGLAAGAGGFLAFEAERQGAYLRLDLIKSVLK